jgi:hypothetical protein
MVRGQNQLALRRRRADHRFGTGCKIDIASPVKIAPPAGNFIQHRPGKTQKMTVAVERRRQGNLPLLRNQTNLA